jgi:hypothetical protein
MGGHRGRVGGQRVTVAYAYSTFPTAPLRTGRERFRSSGSPVSLTSVLHRTSDYLQVRLSILHFARLSRPKDLAYLSPFAMCAAFPRSDYYGDSVTLWLAPLRPSRVPREMNVSG